MTLVFADRIPEILEDYWLGPKGSARVGGWGNPGSYRACLRELAEEGVPAHMIHGECANLYHKATGEWPGRAKEHGLTAAAWVHTGAMIALIPAEADAQRLAVKGGKPPEELHVTLCYLGEGGQWSTEERLRMAASVALSVQDLGPVKGKAFSLAYFNPGDEDMETALVYGIGGDGVQQVYDRVKGAIDYAGEGGKIPAQHMPWVAHITASYVDDLSLLKKLVDRLGPVTFDRVRLAFAGDHYDIPLESPVTEVPEVVVDEPLLPGADDGITELDDVVGPSGYVDMVSLVAAMGTYAPVRWSGPLAPIGSPTGDKRIFPPDTITQATFPQPLRWQERGMPGHEGAVTVAAITHAQEGTWEGLPYIIGEGYWLNPDIIPEVKQAMHLVENGVAGPSVDLDSFAASPGEYAGSPILVIRSGRQRGATLVSIPAFADLRIRNEYPQDVDEPVDYALAAQVEAVTASLDPGLGEWEAELSTFATVNSTSWQSAPIAPREATFDADDAVSRIEAWAGIGTEDADEGKFRSMFMWINADGDAEVTPLGRGGYRLPWGDIFDGKPHLVYHAIYSASALLEGGHGGLPNIPDEDKNQLRNTITKIYAKLATEFKDPNIRASWDVREASAMEVETFAVRASGWSDLPTSTAAWDEGAARAALDAWAGDDMGKYAKGFLWFDEANRENKTAYKFPIAKPVDGRLTVFLAAVNNADARLNQANIPAADKVKIQGILDSIQARYETEASGYVETFASKYDGIHPPRSAFAQKQLTRLTKMQVVPRDGYNEVFGHLADWDSCHLGLQIGNPNMCMKPPRSKRGYKDFHVSTQLTAEGEIVEVGKLTIDAYHGSTRRGLTASQVRAHYEHTGTEAAVGRVYEDQFGPAFFGVQVPNNDAAMAQKIRRTPVSGHWHPVNGHLELVAALGVNRPAYPIVASATGEDIMVDDSTIILMEDGVQTGLIASATFDTEVEMETYSGCCGEEDPVVLEPTPQELRVAQILALPALPTPQEMKAREDRLNSLLQ